MPEAKKKTSPVRKAKTAAPAQAQSAVPAEPEAAQVTDAERWSYALGALANRIASLIDSERADDDVPDHRRGKAFPKHLLVRDAERGAPAPATGMIPWEYVPSSLIELAEVLPLEDIDLAILLIASAISMDPRFEHFFIVLNNDVDARGPMVSTALRLAGASPLDAEARNRLRADAPLAALGLIDVGPASRALLSQVITVPERVIAHLLGDSIPDASIIRSIVQEDSLIPSALLPELPELPGLPVILRARAGTAGRDQARRIAETESGGQPIIMDMRLLDGGNEAVLGHVRAAIREAALNGCFLVLDFRGADADAPINEVLGELTAIGVPAILLVDGRRSLGPWEKRALTLPIPTVAQRREWWKALSPESDDILAETATHLDPEDIALTAGGDESAAILRVAGQARRSRVQTVTPGVTLADVVLDERPRDQMIALRDRVRYRSTVLDEWGMRPGGARGRGVTALFAGPSGTGKSMSAEALAGELNVPLFVVDLASVVDKYIGETEKNLEEVFRTVENEDGVLLFDEADALFGKRSDVSDARDRYANIEVAYLLQRIEAFDGLAILTTNLRANLDDAFQRRLDMIVDFPEPEPAARQEIWSAALAQFDCLDDTDCANLATLDLTGGYIRAAVVTAAYMAAADETTLTRAHVLRGAREEWRKAGRLNFPDAQFAGWVPLD